MSNKVARVTWNRLTKEVRYKSINEEPKLDAVFKLNTQKCFVLKSLRVNSNGYTSADMQAKIQSIAKHLNDSYSTLIQ